MKARGEHKQLGKNSVTEHWDNWSDEYWRKHFPPSILERIVRDPTCAFPPAVWALLRKYLSDLGGKRVCVPSSGDNTAVFAFHLLGARVTSVDISERQIGHARQIAASKGWDIEFLCDDSMGLGTVASGEYDLVYTSNGVHVWIADLPLMYRSFNRILKEDGYFIFFETHPMIRPFDDKGTEIKIVKPYEDIGPFGEVPEYAWRMQDFVNALLLAGFDLRMMEEFHSLPTDLPSYDYFYPSAEARASDHCRLYDWRQNPWAALAQCFALCAQKHPTGHAKAQY
jgi:SAM-dependent methyltransferase